MIKTKEGKLISFRANKYDLETIKRYREKLDKIMKVTDADAIRAGLHLLYKEQHPDFIDGLDSKGENINNKTS